MKITKFEINHFRALEKFVLSIEEDLSVIIGKNNTGKTSLLSILDRFLSESKSSFEFHDFNKKYLASKFPFNQDKILSVEEYEPFYISLNMYIEYNETDYIGNLSKLFMSLDPKEKTVILRFEYVMTYELYLSATKDYAVYCSKAGKKKRTIREYVEKNHSKYFQQVIKSVNPADTNEYVEIKEKSDIQRIINFKYIKAIRDVSNLDEAKAKSQTLSKLAVKYCESRRQETLDESLIDDVLKESDVKLDKSYKKIFKNVITDIERFSYGKGEAKLSVKSMLSASTLIKENANVVYSKETEFLPEEYNGLGYMNLFAMIFYINIQIDEFRKITKSNQVPSDINLLYIEEPEAHTHPQMQYVFIKNIQAKLQEGRKGKEGEYEINLQMILSSHSSHIVSQSNFEKIKFFYRENDAIYSKNLSDLETEMMDSGDNGENRFRFLKQYLTLERSELFFADKVVFVEGDTERILINAMMQKTDIDNKDIDGYVPLMSQNISVVEVGAYSHVFDEFISYLGIKALIITDIDSTKGKVASNGITYYEACKVSSGEATSNASLKHYFNNIPFDELKTLKKSEKTLTKNTKGKWVSDSNGMLRIAYQTMQNRYHARSFEDAFINCNYEFIKQHKNDFKGLKNRGKIKDGKVSYYDIAANCIDKKSTFATDILYFSNNDYSNWIIPEYIKEGLEWLAK